MLIDIVDHEIHEQGRMLMKRVPSAEFVRNFSALCDEALGSPVVLTRNGRDRLIVTNVEQYRHLLSLAVLHVSDESRNESLSSELTVLTRTASGRGDR